MASQIFDWFLLHIIVSIAVPCPHKLCMRFTTLDLLRWLWCGPIVAWPWFVSLLSSSVPVFACRNGRPNRCPLPTYGILVWMRYVNMSIHFSYFNLLLLLLRFFHCLCRCAMSEWILASFGRRLGFFLDETKRRTNERTELIWCRAVKWKIATGPSDGASCKNQKSKKQKKNIKIYLFKNSHPKDISGDYFIHFICGLWHERVCVLALVFKLNLAYEMCQCGCVWRVSYPFHRVNA